MENNEFSQVLDIFGVDASKLEEYHFSNMDDGLHMFLKLKKKECKCPICHSVTSKVVNYVDKKITHSVITTRPCIINYHARRYKCSICGRTFYEDNPFVFNKMKISTVTVYNVLKDLKDPHETFSSVARRYNISATEVTHIFDSHVSISRRKLPKVISLDEVYAMPNDDSKFVLVLLDFETQNIIDILPSRHKKDIANYLTLLPQEERNNVELTSSDLWVSYRDVCNLYFKNSKHCADRFHVLQEFTKQFNSVRIRIMNSNARIKSHYENERLSRKLSVKEEDVYITASRNYYLLKKFNWTLTSKDEKIQDPNIKKKYNRFLNAYMNLYDLYNAVLAIDKNLEEIVLLRESLYKFYESCDINSASDGIDCLIKEFKDSNVKEMRKYSGTLANWRKEIINSFTLVGDSRINNSRIEGVNKIIKNIKFNANGFRNFERMRNRILYCVNDDATFYIGDKKGGDENEKQKNIQVYT